MSAVARDPREPDDLPEDWWATKDVLRYLTAIGIQIERGTWASYVSRGYAPAPTKRFGNSPVWPPNVIRAWGATRESSGT